MAKTSMDNQGKRRLVLIGLRGAGKSTIGRAVGVAQGRDFVDLDQVTPLELGAASVAEAWERFGESGFREGEARALVKQMAREGIVLALGGGTPTAPGCSELLRAARARGEAVIVYLRATPEVLRERLTGAIGTHRPSLTGKDPLLEIDELFAQRDEAYQRLATRIVENIRSVDDAVARLEDWEDW